MAFEQQVQRGAKELRRWPSSLPAAAWLATPVAIMIPQAGRSVLEVSFLREVNWSVLRSGIPFVWRLRVVNQSPATLGALRLGFTIPGYLECAEVSVPELPPGVAHEVRGQDLSWRVDYDAATRRRDTADEFLHVTIRDRTVRHLVQLLAPVEWYPGVASSDDSLVLDAGLELIHWRVGLADANTLGTWVGREPWEGRPELQACAAALVQPDHPAVRLIKAKAMTLLSAMADAPRLSLDEHLSGGALEQSQLMQATFHALAQFLPTAYHDIEKFSPRTRSQRIRLPHEATEAAGSLWPGATCIDFALLLCATLENAGLSPLLVLLGTQNLICHAMVGAWLSDPGEEVLLTDAERVRQAVAAGNLRFVDVTEFAHNRSFKSACERGASLLRECQFLYALDVRAARRVHGIEPLPFSPGPGGDGPGDIVRPHRVVHPLPPARDFQGRGELAAIARFWSEHRSGGVLGLEGMGGSGKTALVERFLCELPGAPFERNGVAKRPDLPRPQRMLVWSFYEAGDSGEFVAELFDYFCESAATSAIEAVAKGGRSASVHARGSRTPPASLMARLAAIQQALAAQAGSRTLLVLDGLERIQHEKHGLGRFREDATPVRQFLQWIAQHPSGVWVIATSRLPLTDIHDWQGNGYVRLTVGGLEASAARALLRTRGVWGTDDQLDTLAGEFGWHALTLTHLGGLLKIHASGDPTQTTVLPPLTKIGGAAEQEAQAQKIGRILAFYEHLLGPEAAALLKIISVFRTATSEEAVAAAASCSGLLGPETPRYQLRDTLQRLCDLQLLQEHTGPEGTKAFAVHPAVGRYFYEALGEDAIQAHEGVEKYLERQVPPEAVRVPVRGVVRTRGAASLRGTHATRLPAEPPVLDLLEEMVYHTLAAGHGEAAYRVYRERLGGYEHLGRSLGDFSRGARLTGLFLPPAPTALPQDSPYLPRIKEDHDRFVRSLEPGAVGSA